MVSVHDQLPLPNKSLSNIIGKSLVMYLALNQLVELEPMNLWWLYLLFMSSFMGLLYWRDSSIAL